MPAFILIPGILFSLIAASIVIWKGISRKSTPSLPTILGGALFLGGAFSNIVDRLMRGCIPDFFHLSWFPAFNMADIGISLGAFLLFISIKHRKM